MPTWPGRISPDPRAFGSPSGTPCMNTDCPTGPDVCPRPSTLVAIPGPGRPRPPPQTGCPRGPSSAWSSGSIPGPAWLSSECNRAPVRSRHKYAWRPAQGRQRLAGSSPASWPGPLRPFGAPPRPVAPRLPGPHLCRHAPNVSDQATTSQTHRNMTSCPRASLPKVEDEKITTPSLSEKPPALLCWGRKSDPLPSPASPRPNPDRRRSGPGP